MFKPEEFHRHPEELGRVSQGGPELNDRDAMARDDFRLLEDAGFAETMLTLRSSDNPLQCRTVVRVTASGLVALRIAEGGRGNAFELYQQILSASASRGRASSARAMDAGGAGGRDP